MRETEQRRRGIPGTTPLVAIALIDIAVNSVCTEGERDRFSVRIKLRKIRVKVKNKVENKV